jgi:signal transduction histidine kinase
MLSLVSDILDFERIESNQLQLEHIPFSIADEAQMTIRLLQHTAGSFPSFAALRACLILCRHREGEAEPVTRYVDLASIAPGRPSAVRGRIH